MDHEYYRFNEDRAEAHLYGDDRDLVLAIVRMGAKSHVPLRVMAEGNEVLVQSCVWLDVADAVSWDCIQDFVDDAAIVTGYRLSKRKPLCHDNGYRTILSRP